MKFEKVLLIRNIENPKDYEIKTIKVGFKELMAEDSEKIINFCISFFSIWFALCLMFASILGFAYLLKTYF